MHYNQTRKRNAEFITPPNKLKAKAGSGGVSDEILEKAQQLLESNTVDFEPLATMYLNELKDAIETIKHAKPEEDREYLISLMLFPAMQLKANGGMFHYPLITDIADKLIQFLEVIDEADIDAVEIIHAFHTTMNVIIQGKVQGNGNMHGIALLKALKDACGRYFQREL